MGYYIDLSQITIDQYRLKLESAYLPPSRRMLKDKLDERMGYFKSIGINNIQELIQILKRKSTFNELQSVECLSGDYLPILLRELNSTLPKPNKISEFQEISEDAVAKLKKIGIINTVQLYDKVITSQHREELADSTGITDQEILKLAKLTDLSRIKWVGVTFARMLYDLGVDTVAKAAKADPVELHARINHICKEKKLYKGKIGLNDIRILVNAANEVPLEIEY